MSKCPACPVAEGPCHGETVRPHFCAMAAGGEPSALMLIRDVSAGDKPLPPVPPPPLGPPPAPRRTARTAAVERVNTVGFLCRSCASGCQRATCFAGRGDDRGEVSMQDCFRCVGILKET